MTAQEMIAQVKFRLQRNSHNQYSNITDSEIEIALNEAQLNFIKRRFQSGTIADRQKANQGQLQRRNDDLQQVLIANRQLPMIKPDVDGYDSHLYDDGVHYAILPADYMFLINARVKNQYVKDYGCGELDIIEGPKLKSWTCAVPYNAVEGDLCVGNPIFKIQIDSTVIFDLADWNLRIKSIDDKYKIIKLVLEYLNRFNSLTEIVNYNNPTSTTVENTNNINYFNVYWERYRDQYYPESFVFVSFSADVTTASDSNDAYFNSNNYGMNVQIFTDGTLTPHSERRFQQRSYLTEQLNDSSYPTGLATINSAVRIVDSENVHKVRSYPFSVTTKSSPIGDIKNGHLFVYSDNKFVPQQLRMDYIKKPRQINAKLGFNCELADHTHDEIVSLATLSMLETTSNLDRMGALAALIQRNE